MATLKLPSRAGAILLPETTLFPHGALPLRIFEPRYREMLNDALEGDCFFCVGTLTGDETGDPGNCVAPVGTIGLIRASHEQADGSSELLLHGICRVHFQHWHQDRAYPVANFKPFHSIDISERQEAIDLDRLRVAVTEAASQLPGEVSKTIKGVLDRIKDAFTATDVIAQQFVSDSAQRRALLEEPAVAKRIDTLIGYLTGVAR